MSRLSSALIFTVLIAQLTGCKKINLSNKSEFSFTYNGQTYHTDTVNTYGGSSNFLGFEFYGHAAFGGKLHYTWSTTNECAYIEPTELDLFFDNSCTFHSGGNPVDSSKIYTYVSGSKNFTVSDCKTKSFLGQTMTTCTVSGSFSVVLINNAGLTRSVTGTFKFVSVPY